jgi:hypothetical protein
MREQLWDDCLDTAIGEAEGGMDRHLQPLTLKGRKVFEDECRLG